MGWLLACFGCTKKRKRPKKASKFGPKSRRIRCYQPLEPDVLCHQLDSSQALTSSNLNLREKPKEENNTTRIGKRVRFNLEVTTYELLPADDDDDDYEQGNQNWGERDEEDDDDDEQQRTRKAFLGYTALSKPASYPSNHRYNNWCDDEDEYHDGNDDVEDELSDLTDDEDEEEDDDEVPEEYHHIISVPLSSSDDGELVSGNGSTINTRFRSHYVVPVLNPIENLSQWKAVKARRKC